MIIFYFPSLSLNTHNSHNPAVHVCVALIAILHFPNAELNSISASALIFNCALESLQRCARKPSVQTSGQDSCLCVGAEMWVTERTVTAGCYTIGDGWYAGGSGHESYALVGNPHASWVPVSFSIPISVPGVSQATGQARRRWQMGTPAPFCCQLAWRC